MKKRTKSRKNECKKDGKATSGKVFHMEHSIVVTQNSAKSGKRLKDFEEKMGL